MKKVSAYLSIFMSLTLTVVLSLYFVLVEAVRENTLRLEAECIVDTAMNSVLAEYHRVLLERYNLFFVDSSYGSAYPSFYNTEAHLREYIDRNCSSGDGKGPLEKDDDFWEVYIDPLEMKVVDTQILAVSLATDNAGYNFQKQAVKAWESDSGVGLLKEVQDWITVIEEHALLDNNTEAMISSLENQLRAIKGRKQLEDEVWVSVSVENPMEEIFEQRKKGLLWCVGDGILEVSSKRVNLENYISARKKSGKYNKGNIENKGNLTLYERLVFGEYLLKYAGNYRKVREESGLDYQIEYLLFGEDSDTGNLGKTAAAICGIREAANLIYIMNDDEKRAEARGIASAMSMALLVPEAEPLLEGIILVGWSCVESIQDVRDLMDGMKVPLLKNQKNESLELQYEDYLRILLYFSNLETITYRFMDVLEMDIRKTKGNQFFRIDGCIDYFEAKVSIESEYGKEYALSHAKGYK